MYFVVAVNDDSALDKFFLKHCYEIFFSGPSVHHHQFSFDRGSSPSTTLARLRVFLRSLTSPRLTILFDHLHPLLPVHFSSFHPLLVFSMYVSIFLCYPALQISPQDSFKVSLIFILVSLHFILKTCLIKNLVARQHTKVIRLRVNSVLFWVLFLKRFKCSSLHRTRLTLLIFLVE